MRNKNSRVRKNKGKLLNGLIILIMAGAVAFTPLVAVSSTVQAVPQLPSTPDIPDSEPDSPESPTLPDNYTGTNNDPSTDSSTDTGSHQSESTEGTTQEASNSDTGADSTNNAETSTTNDTDATINNDANVDNNTIATIDSGHNSSDKNTGDGSVTSGDVGINANLETDLNQVLLGENGGGEISLGELSSSNNNTGSGSANNSSSENINDTNLLVDNDLDINNSGYFDADSGHNSADKNTGDGEVVSGDADIVLLALNVGNNVNVGTQIFNVYDDQTGDLIIDFNNVTALPVGYSCSGESENSSTGADSGNDASTLCDSNTTIVVDNFGNVLNDYYLTADTGSNSADKNTGDGSVTTGDVNITANIINFINNTFLGGGGELLLGIVNIFGNLSGDIVLNMPNSGDEYFYSPTNLSASNASTGADSENNANSTLSNNSDITLLNNLDLLNNVTLFASTGGNTADKNTGEGSIQTGNIDSNINLVNIANTNSIGADGTLWMVLVNNLGEWGGQIWGFDSSGVASPFYTFAIGDGGELTAINGFTGAGSENNASSTSNNNTNTLLNNNTSLTNNIYINANTGNNSASMNTGSGSIKTGNVNVAANIVNLINNNFLAGRFVLTIVNVFGGFFGNIFPDGKDIINGAPLLTDENTSVVVSAGGSVEKEYKVGSFSGFGGGYVSGSDYENSENSGSVIIAGLKNVTDKVKVDSVRKIVGTDPTTLTDYWWVIIPLLTAVGSALIRRRFAWRTHSNT